MNFYCSDIDTIQFIVLQYIWQNTDNTVVLSLYSVRYSLQDICFVLAKMPDAFANKLLFATLNIDKEEELKKVGILQTLPDYIVPIERYRHESPEELPLEEKDCQNCRILEDQLKMNEDYKLKYQSVNSTSWTKGR